MTFGLAAGALLAAAWNNAWPEPGPRVEPAPEVATVSISDRGLSGVLVHEEVHEYVLSGPTVEALHRQLRRTGGFRSAHRQPAWSATSGALSIDWEPAQGWACGERPVVRVDLVTHLPSVGDVPSELAGAFRPFRTAIERHEDEHARQWLHAARGLRNELSGLYEWSCVGLRSQAEWAVARWTDQARSAGRILDSDTEDGRSTGAVFDVRPELRLVHFPHAIVNELESGRIDWNANLVRFDAPALTTDERRAWTECLRTTEVVELPDATPHAVLQALTSEGSRPMGLFLDGTVTRKGRAWRADCVEDLLRENARQVGAALDPDE